MLGAVTHTTLQQVGYHTRKKIINPIRISLLEEKFLVIMRKHLLLLEKHLRILTEKSNYLLLENINVLQEKKNFKFRESISLLHVLLV